MYWMEFEYASGWFYRNLCEGSKIELLASIIYQNGFGDGICCKIWALFWACDHPWPIFRTSAIKFWVIFRPVKFLRFQGKMSIGKILYCQAANRRSAPRLPDKLQQICSDCKTTSLLFRIRLIGKFVLRLTNSL